MEALAAPRSSALAGGTDLLIRLRDGAKVERVVNLKRIEALGSIRRTDAGTEIGASVTLARLVREGGIPLLAETALQMASPQIRNLATVVGNLCNASPAADLAPPLLCLEARVRIAGAGNSREVALGDFIAGPGRTCLKAGEIVTHVVVPPDGAKGTYLKFTVRNAMDIAIVGVAVVRSAEGVRIALGAVAPTPIRARAAEKAKDPAEVAAAECSPIDDLRASAGYRREIVRVLVRRALEATA